MAEPILTFHLDPAPESTAPLGEALRAFNESQVGPYRRATVAVMAHDQEGALLGGIQGIVLFGWLYIERFWVAAERRSQGLGSELLGHLEREAAAKGARSVALLTTDWQAPDFYARHGYERIASFDLILDAARQESGAVDHLFVKRLDAGSAPGARAPAAWRVEASGADTRQGGSP